MAHGITKTVALNERVVCALLKFTLTTSPILIWSFVSIDFMSVTSYPPNNSLQPTGVTPCRPLSRAMRLGRRWLSSRRFAASPLARFVDCLQFSHGSLSLQQSPHLTATRPMQAMSSDIVRPLLRERSGLTNSLETTPVGAAFLFEKVSGFIKF